VPLFLRSRSTDCSAIPKAGHVTPTHHPPPPPPHPPPPNPPPQPPFLGKDTSKRKPVRSRFFPFLSSRIYVLCAPSHRICFFYFPTVRAVLDSPWPLVPQLHTPPWLGFLPSFPGGDPPELVLAHRREILSSYPRAIANFLNSPDRFSFLNQFQ